MGRCSAVILIVLLVLATATARADLIGHYKVSGRGPDGLPYSGEVAVEMIGDTVHVVREIGGRRHVGTGLGYKNILAVTYRMGDGTMLALYAQNDAGRWSGTWTYADSQAIGIERWEPHESHR